MAIKRYSGDRFTGLNADTKPTDVEAGAIFTETDTNTLYQFDGSSWNELAYASSSHTHSASDITSGTFADGRISESSVTQHESALAVTESQISDLGSYITPSSTDTLTNKSGSNNQWTNDAGYITATLTNEEVQDIVGGMVAGNTETLISVTYDDPNGKLDFSVEANLSNYNNDAGFLTSEVNDLTSAVTWANVPDGNIAQSSVVQHEGALTITESQISDLSHYTDENARDAIGTALVGGTDIGVDVDDGANTITISYTGSAGAVDSVFGRTGAVTAESGDYTAAQVDAVSAASGGTFSSPITISANNGVTVSGTLPRFRLDETDTTDENLEILITSGSFQIQQRTDSFGFIRNILNMDISADTLIHSGNFSTYGVPNTGGTFTGHVNFESSATIDGTTIIRSNGDEEGLRFTTLTGFSYLQFGGSNSSTNINARISRFSTGSTPINSLEIFTNSLKITEGDAIFKNDSAFHIQLDRTANAGVDHVYSIGVSNTDGILLYNLTDSDPIAFFRHGDIQFNKELTVNAGATFTGNVGINKPEAILNLGIGGHTGEHGLRFYDSDNTVGLALVYRTTPEELYIEDGIDGTQLVSFDKTGNVTATSATFTGDVNMDRNNINEVSSVILGISVSGRVQDQEAIQPLIEWYDSTSSAMFSTQDGNGRIQLKWNATHGTSETYLVSSEPAFFMDMGISSNPIYAIRYASGGTAGNAISWSNLWELDSNGDVTATDFIVTSDARIKSNETPIEGALESLRGITPYYFDKNGERKVGYIAQNVEQFTQNVVSKVERDGYTDFRIMNMFGMQAYNTQAIKELNNIVVQLKNRVQELEQEIKTLRDN